MNLHAAFSVDLDILLQAADRLREANIIPLDFAGEAHRLPARGH